MSNPQPNNPPNSRNALRQHALGALSAAIDKNPTSIADTIADPWVKDLVAGTLRAYSRLEWVIDAHALKKKPSGAIRKKLALATYQLLFQTRQAVPERIVSETVSWVKDSEGESASKFANAVLRKIATERARWRDHLELGDADWIRAASLPDWIARPLEKAKGREWAARYGMYSMERPSNWIRAKAGWTPPAGDARFVALPAVPGAFLLETDGTRLEDLPGFKEGAWFVQDIASQWMVSEVLRAHVASGGQFPKRVLDLCASPGGKAFALAMSGVAEVVATDLDDRLPRLRENTQRLGLGAGVKTATKAELESHAPFDWVWVDAPCSGSGILRRHPEIRSPARERSLHGLARGQTQLLEEAAKLVAPGGIIVYSVCSVLPAEGRARVDALASRGDLEVVSVGEINPCEAPSEWPAMPDGFQWMVCRSSLKARG